jgi:peptidyl-prolyl cis-trans isomerase C
VTLATLRSLVAAATLTVAASVYAQPAAPAAGAAAPAAAAAEPQVDPNKIIITAGDQKITASEFDAWIKLLPAETQAIARGEGKRRAAEELIKMRMLAAEARAKGLDKSPTYQQQLQLMADQVLIGMLLQDMEARLASEEEIKKQYDNTKADYDKVTARHILIPTRGPTALKDEDAKKKADDIKARLDKGEDFAAIA